MHETTATPGPAGESPAQPLIDLHADPFVLFRAWMAQAQKSEPSDPNAMSVATATPDGRPSVRILLLKAIDENGFVFYTNCESRKGKELRANPRTALLFHWKTLRRQIRIEGKAVPVSAKEADAYFESRSRLSRLGAIASRQSSPLKDRAVFEKRLEQARTHYGEGPIPRPGRWSGFRVIPEQFEFWQERPYRLHDRALWKRETENTKETQWSSIRLYP